jgi:hypothetical protein
MPDPTQYEPSEGAIITTFNQVPTGWLFRSSAEGRWATRAGTNTTRTDLVETKPPTITIEIPLDVAQRHANRDHTGADDALISKACQEALDA